VQAIKWLSPSHATSRWGKPSKIADLEYTSGRAPWLAALCRPAQAQRPLRLPRIASSRSMRGPVDRIKDCSLMLDFQFDRAVPAMGRAVMPSFRPAPRYLFLTTLIHIKDASRQAVHQELAPRVSGLLGRTNVALRQLPRLGRLLWALFSTAVRIPGFAFKVGSPMIRRNGTTTPISL